MMLAFYRIDCLYVSCRVSLDYRFQFRDYSSFRICLVSCSSFGCLQGSFPHFVPDLGDQDAFVALLGMSTLQRPPSISLYAVEAREDNFLRYHIFKSIEDHET